MKIEPMSFCFELGSFRSETNPPFHTRHFDFIKVLWSVYVYFGDDIKLAIPGHGFLVHNYGKQLFYTNRCYRLKKNKIKTPSRRQPTHVCAYVLSTRVPSRLRCIHVLCRRDPFKMRILEKPSSRAMPVSILSNASVTFYDVSTL